MFHALLVKSQAEVLLVSTHGYLRFWQAIAKNTKLETLYLNSNGIGRTGADALFAVQQSGTTLKKLVLVNNPVSIDQGHTVDL